MNKEMVMKLTDMEVAYLLYGLENYELEELGENKEFVKTKERVFGLIHQEYTDREIDYDQFLLVNSCPNCGSILTG